MKRSEQAYVRDMLAWGLRLATNIGDMSEADFLADAKTQDSAAYAMLAIGEAAKQLTTRYPDFGARHPHIRLRGLIATRDVLAHGYLKLDATTLWETATMNMPELIAQIEGLAEGSRDP